MNSIMAQGPAILIGYDYRVRLEADVAVFAEGASFIAQVRLKPSSPDVAAVLSSTTGEIERVSDTSIDLHIPATSTNGMAPGSVVLDVVRDDLNPPLHLGFSLKIPVQLPVTRGLS